MSKFFLLSVNDINRDSGTLGEDSNNFIQISAFPRLVQVGCEQCDRKNQERSCISAVSLSQEIQLDICDFSKTLLIRTKL